MTTLQEAAQAAMKYIRSTADYKAGHPVAIEAAEDLSDALAQQGEQQPVCHGCGIPAGDVHMSTCKSGKWPSRVSNGDTAAPAPAPQAQDGRYIIAGSVWFRKSTDEWVLELSGSINDTSFVARHTQPAETLPENVPSLPTLYAPAPQAQGLTGCACRWDAADKRVATCERHQGWLDVIQECYGRAKEAESALQSAQQALKAEEVNCDKCVHLHKDLDRYPCDTCIHGVSRTDNFKAKT